MSRKYLNDKYCVRCGRKDPTPYLRDNYKHLLTKKSNVCDIGCGNGRNSNFIKSLGHTVNSFDMVNDYGQKLILGRDKFPLERNSVDAILCNYLMMFLNQEERDQVVSEINRVARIGCRIMLELYAAKDSEAQTKEEILKMQKDIFDKLGWEKVKYSQERFIAEKVCQGKVICEDVNCFKEMAEDNCVICIHAKPHYPISTHFDKEGIMESCIKGGKCGYGSSDWECKCIPVKDLAKKKKRFIR